MTLSVNVNHMYKIPNWPALGFLYGENILCERWFNILNNYNFDDWAGQDPAFAQRRFITMDDVDYLTGDLRECMKEIHGYCNNADILMKLMKKSFEGETVRPERIWAGGIDSIKQLHKDVIVMFCQDPPDFSMDPHCDHRQVIGNLQVYIRPDMPQIGTLFHKCDDPSATRVSPFRPNCGYFLSNTHLGLHSIQNKSGLHRRSIIISWTL